MIGRDSISFGSIRQSAVWHNQDPPNPGQNNSINFHQFPLSQRNYLDQSKIRRIPAQKSTKQINRFMQNNLDVVCLFQAAQIKRLITNLQQHQIKFKQLQSHPLNRQSYQIQIRQLAQASHELQLQNSELKMKCEKLKNFIIKQNAEISKLSQQLKQKQQYAIHSITLNNQIQSLSRKYQKSIESLNKLFDDNQHLTNQKLQLIESLGTFKQENQAMKQIIVQLEQRKQYFEEQRIKQIQRMRESYDAKIMENSTKLRSQVQIQASGINRKFQQTNNSLNHSLNQLSQQLKVTESKFIHSMQDNKMMQGQLKQIRNQLQLERERNNSERNDFDEKLKLFGDQIQRLNSILKNKQGHIIQLNGQLQNIRSVSLRQKTQKQQLERTFQQAKRTLESLASKNRQLQTMLSMKQGQTTRLNEHIDHLAQSLEYEEKQSNENALKYQQISSLKQVIQMQLIQSRRHYNDEKNRLIEGYQQKIIRNLQQNKFQDQRNSQSWGEQNDKLRNQLKQYKGKIEQIMHRNSEVSSSKQVIIRNYQQKIRQYFQQNQQLKTRHETLKAEHETLIEQDQTIKKVAATSAIMIQDTKDQLNQLQQKCSSLGKVNSLIQLKVKNLERQKVAIQKQLQKQVVQFMQNNQKSTLMLYEHKSKVDLVNYQKQYSGNHVMLLKQIQKLNNKLLCEEDEKNQVIAKLQLLQQTIQRLQQELRQYHEAVLDDLKTKGKKLANIDTGVQQLSMQKQLINQNKQLSQRVYQSQIQKHQSQGITQKAIFLTSQNSRLKHQIQQLQINYNKLHKQYNQMVRQFKFQNQEKQRQIKEEQRQIKAKQIQTKEEQRNNNQKQDTLTNRNISKLLLQFKQLNQSLLVRLSHIQAKQTQQMHNLQLSHSIKNKPFIGQQSKNVFSTQSQLYHLQTSNIISSQMSFNPSKFMQATKSHEQNVQQYNQLISRLKEQLKQLSTECQQKQQQLKIIKSASKFTQQKNHQLQVHVRDLQIQKQNNCVKSEQFGGMQSINRKLIDQNRLMIYQIQEMKEELGVKQLLIVKISSALKDMQDELKVLARKHTQMLSTSEEYQGVKIQMQVLRKQLEKKDDIVHNYNQKFITLVTQIQSFSQQLKQLQKQNIILQEQNLMYKQKQIQIQSQRKSLKKTNYGFAIQLQKSRVTTGKISVLNQQIQRLQKQNIDLIEELDICKFEICQDLSLQRKNQELLAALVESLRSRVKQKDAEINTIRKSNLNNYKST